MEKMSILKHGQKPTDEQIAEIKAAAQKPIVYDKDCPESTPEMLEAFRKAAEVRDKMGGLLYK